MIFEVDEETAGEVMSSFDDHYDTLQTSLNKLIRNNSDLELINLTFRSIHTVKGNATMVDIAPLINYTHAVEEVMASIRSGYFIATPTLCDILLMSIDRLRDLHTKYLFNKDIPPINEQPITDTFTAMAKVRTAEDVDGYCQQLIKLFTPVQTMKNSESAIPNVTVSTIKKDNLSDHSSYLELNEQQQEDLILFRILSLQVDEQNSFWNQRTDSLLYLALKTVELSAKPIDKTQLVAATYMHDAGMAFVADSIVNKNNKLNPMETKKLQQHPVWGYSLLSRMEGWQDAAQIILEHHEHIDGGGYPYGKKGGDLSDGAKLLAITDAYYAMTNLRADRSHRRSIMRAISEINACVDAQFCSYWVSVFNEVIRTEVKLGSV